MKVTLKPLTMADAPAFWQLAYGDEDAAWTQWNGPYFHDQLPSREQFLTKIAPIKFIDQPNQRVIWVDTEMVGSVSYHYADGDLRRWLEVGIVIYRQDNWQQGIGKAALTQWITQVWTQTALPHLGLTTWSGNTRMCHLAESIGWQEEGRIRQVRYWQGKYWDSVKYGCLREEWRG